MKAICKTVGAAKSAEPRSAHYIAELRSAYYMGVLDLSS
jgi:hypothetical protein